MAKKQISLLLFMAATFLAACAAPLSPTALPSNTPAPRAATPPPPSVEKIQLQAGSSDPHAITELKVEPAQLELRPLEVAKVRVLARLANGQTVEVINHSKLQWQIAEPTQITLLNGTVKALAPGESEVLIRAGTQETRLKVKIPAVLDGGSASGSILSQPELVLPQPLYRLAVGENVYLQASLKAADGSESKDLIFSVDKPELFELDSQSGRLRRLKAGPAKVTVQARLNGDLLKTIALEDKVIESPSSTPTSSHSPPPLPSAISTPVIVFSPVPSATPLMMPTPTPLSSPTPTPLATPIPTALPTPTPTPTSIPTPLPTPTPTPTPTALAAPTPTPTPRPVKSCGILTYPSSVIVGETANFTATNSHNPETAIRWTFQDTPSTTIMTVLSPYLASKVWTQPGNYWVRVEAVRSNGMGPIECEGSPITVDVTAPE